jgi:hypothetical protein
MAKSKSFNADNAPLALWEYWIVKIMFWMTTGVSHVRLAAKYFQVGSISEGTGKGSMGLRPRLSEPRPTDRSHRPPL